jgi:hypothetical protein
MDELSKIWTPNKKKDQSANAQTPSEICRFLPYPSEMAFLNLDIKWNGPLSGPRFYFGVKITKSHIQCEKLAGTQGS